MRPRGGSHPPTLALPAMRRILALFRRDKPTQCTWCREPLAPGVAALAYADRPFCGAACLEQFKLWAKVMIQTWPRHLLLWQL